MLGKMLTSLALATMLSSVVSASSQVHVVTVGEANNAFRPNITHANVGDIISFQFFPPNHSVVRSAFEFPCVPIEDVQNTAGFFSGFVPVAAVEPDPPTFNITVNDTQPIFFYCAAPGSCIDYQMVGVINPANDSQLATQARLASQSDYMLVPGQPFPAEASSSVAALAATATATTAATATAATSSASTSKKGISTTVVVGIIVGVVAGLLLCCALLFYFGRQKRLRNTTVPDKTGRQRSDTNNTDPDLTSLTVEPKAHPQPAPMQTFATPLTSARGPMGGTEVLQGPDGTLFVPLRAANSLPYCGGLIPPPGYTAAQQMHEASAYPDLHQRSASRTEYASPSTWTGSPQMNHMSAQMATPTLHSTTFSDTSSPGGPPLQQHPALASDPQGYYNSDNGIFEAPPREIARRASKQRLDRIGVSSRAESRTGSRLDVHELGA